MRPPTHTHASPPPTCPPHPQAHSPQPSNPQPQTLNPQPQVLNPQPQVPHPAPHLLELLVPLAAGKGRHAVRQPHAQDASVLHAVHHSVVQYSTAQSGAARPPVAPAKPGRDHRGGGVLVDRYHGRHGKQRGKGGGPQDSWATTHAHKQCQRTAAGTGTSVVSGLGFQGCRFRGCSSVAVGWEGAAAHARPHLAFLLAQGLRVSGLGGFGV